MVWWVTQMQKLLHTTLPPDTPRGAAAAGSLIRLGAAKQKLSAQGGKWLTVPVIISQSIAKKNRKSRSSLLRLRSVFEVATISINPSVRAGFKSSRQEPHTT